MTRRPDPFDQAALEEALRRAGCPDSAIASTVSNYRLFVPLVFAELGEERVLEIVCRARHTLGLGEQRSAWHTSVKHLVAWARATVDEYRQRRGIEQTSDPADKTQPRLL